VIKRVQRADGIKYQVYGRANGQKIYLSTHDSPKAARAADEDHRTQQRKIASGQLPANADHRRTFPTAVRLWLAALKAAKSRSLTIYTSRVDNHLDKAFGDMPLVEIHRSHVENLRNSLSEAGVGAATVNGLMDTVSSACTWFIGQRWIEANPCHRIKRLTKVEKLFPWIQSIEAITRLLSVCTNNIRNLVAVLVGTGLRLDEALHLRWDDIDLEHRLITVHRGRQGAPKSGKMRRVPIFDSVLVVLKQMKLERGKNVMLWPGRGKGGVRAQTGIRLPFHASTARAGLPEDLRIHDLRHTFASLFLVDGGDIFKLSKILGHSSVRITEKIYAHLLPTAYEADYGRVAFRMPSTAAVLTLAK
jgi:integrase